VRQRADRYKAIGPPKSESGERTVPMLPWWRMRSRSGDWRARGARWTSYSQTQRATSNPITNIVLNGLLPAQVAAGVAVHTVDGEGKPVVQAKYTGLHALRHF